MLFLFCVRLSRVPACPVPPGFSPCMNPTLVTFPPVPQNLPADLYIFLSMCAIIAVNTYRITAERRRIMPNDYTKTAIKAAFIRPLNERPLNKISVKKHCGYLQYQPQYLYYHYQDFLPCSKKSSLRQPTRWTQQHDSGTCPWKPALRAPMGSPRITAAPCTTSTTPSTGMPEDFLMRMCAHCPAGGGRDDAGRQDRPRRIGTR